MHPSTCTSSVRLARRALLAAGLMACGGLAPASATDAPSEDLAARVAALESKLRLLEAQIAPRDVGTDHGTPAQANPETAEQRRQRRAEQRASLDREIDVHTDWEYTRAREATLRRTALTVDGAKPRRMSVTCGTEYCRVVLRHAGPSEQAEFLDAVQGRAGFDSAGFAHTEDAGTSFVYLQRR